MIFYDFFFLFQAVNIYALDQSILKIWYKSGYAQIYPQLIHYEKKLIFFGIEPASTQFIFRNQSKFSKNFIESQKKESDSLQIRSRFILDSTLIPLNLTRLGVIRCHNSIFLRVILSRF